MGRNNVSTKMAEEEKSKVNFINFIKVVKMPF